MNSNTSQVDLSVIVPVCERTRDTVALYQEYKEYLNSIKENVEFIFVVGATAYGRIGAELEKVNREDEQMSVIVMSRDFGEATAIKVGISEVNGDLILILPPYKQVETESLGKLFDGLENSDIALGKRWPRLDGAGNQLQTKAFNFLLRKLSKQDYTDIGCGIRLVKAEALSEINLYGDQHRFLPLLAHEVGYSSSEVELPQAPEDAHSRIYKPWVYFQRLLDLITIIFLTQFNKKPLRFFGLIGSANIIIGMLGLLYLGFERLFLDTGLADRPLLVLFSLFFVLGFQLLAIGLVGEIIVFTHAGDKKEYRIRKIVN